MKKKHIFQFSDLKNIFCFLLISDYLNIMTCAKNI